MSEERVQKLLARAGVASRRHVEEMIRAGRVTVNGTVAELGAKADPAKDSVKLDGRRIPLKAVEPVYLLLHKPPAVMSTVEDPEGRPTVLDLVPPPLRKGLFPVGRLDFQTTGLLLLTNDGDFALRVSHPRYGCTKTYEVKVKGRPEAAKLDRLRRGIYLDRKKTAPAVIEHRPLPRGVGSPDNSWWTVILNEGRTRQIREMFLRIGHPVQKLRRVAIGPIGDKHLPLGQVRPLTPGEVKALLSPQAPPDAGKPRRRRPAPAAGPSKPAKGRAGKGRPIQGKPVQGKADQGKPDQGKPVRGKPASGKPARGEPGKGRPIQGKPAQGKPVRGKPAQGKPVRGKPVQGKPVRGRGGEGRKGGGGSGGGAKAPRRGRPGRPAGRRRS